MGEWVGLYTHSYFRLNTAFVGYVEQNACDSDMPWLACVSIHSLYTEYGFPTKKEAKAFVETTVALVLGE